MQLSETKEILEET